MSDGFIFYGYRHNWEGQGHVVTNGLAKIDPRNNIHS